MLPWFNMYFFDIARPCYDKLTSVKTRPNFLKDESIRGKFEKSILSKPKHARNSAKFGFKGFFVNTKLVLSFIHINFFTSC